MANPPAPFASPMAPSQMAPPPPTIALASLLGVQGTQRFLVQHLLIGPAHSYRVMDHEKRPLFSVGENVRAERQEMWGRFMQPAIPTNFQVNWGPRAPPVSYWVVDDAGGNARAALALNVHGGGAVATLSDMAGAPLLAIQVTRGLASITAQATTADGRPVLEARGNLFHHNFSLHDGSGGEVAKIHESYVSMRDTYNLDLVGPVDPVHATVFAILIDHFKGK
jgi:hypothetical protein